jgi:preprotein translocase subunit SecF
MANQIVIRLGMSCVLLLTLPAASDEVVRFFQFPHIFGGVAAIASCIGACVPILTMFQNSD